jgi:hypothetical protein
MESTIFTPVLTPTSRAFVLEGGRLAATQRPTWGELCLKQALVSLSAFDGSQSNSQSRGRFVAMGESVARYTIPSGSAFGGTG